MCSAQCLEDFLRLWLFFGCFGMQSDLELLSEVIQVKCSSKSGILISMLCIFLNHVYEHAELVFQLHKLIPELLTKKILLFQSPLQANLTGMWILKVFNFVNKQ